MRQTLQLFNRRTRRHIYLAWGALSLALWLFITAAETYQPLHAWLHGGSIPDNDDCAVAVLIHGKIDSVDCNSPASESVMGLEIITQPEIFAFIPASLNLPAGRAPPLLPFVS